MLSRQGIVLIVIRPAQKNIVPPACTFGHLDRISLSLHLGSVIGSICFFCQKRPAADFSSLHDGVEQIITADKNIEAD